MDLSIIIVSYNVKTYLDQCLHSVERAVKNINAEVIVVDNCSGDNTEKHVRKEFPWVQFIENSENLGFGKANNIGARQSSGSHILYLNPDTVVPEDNFEIALKQFNHHEKLGSLGCRMIDGKGDYLPESKRGFPTPSVALYRLFGLAKMFPKSKKWAGYYMGHIEETVDAEVEIQCGAWMMLSRDALTKSGGFDEDFFMYGEDIDLSHRISKLGFKNRYFSQSPVIHYKGESTKHASWVYVKNFHEAMAIFAHKHFTSGAKAYSSMIKIGIYAKASSAVIKRWMSFIRPIALTAVGGFFLANEFTDYWELNQRDPNGGEYPIIYRQIIISAYLIIWILSMIISGAYSLKTSILRYISGFLISTIILLSVYALLPLELRFSRILILISSVLFFISFLFVKTATKTKLKYGLFKLFDDTIAHVDRDDKRSLPVTSNYDIRMEEVLTNRDLLKPNEIHFYPNNSSFKKIIDTMILLRDNNLRFRMIYPFWTLGSDDYQISSELSTAALSKPSVRRTKGILSVIISLAVIVFFLILILFPRGRLAIKNLPAVIRGKKTWVSYNGISSDALPPLKQGVFSHTHLVQDKEFQKFSNNRYAHHWRPEFDIYALFNGAI